MFLLVVFTRWAEAGPRVFQAPVISGGAKSAARTGGGGRGRVIFAKSLSCLPLSRAGSPGGGGTAVWDLARDNARRP